MDKLAKYYENKNKEKIFFYNRYWYCVVLVCVSVHIYNIKDSSFLGRCLFYLTRLLLSIGVDVGYQTRVDKQNDFMNT